MALTSSLSVLKAWEELDNYLISYNELSIDHNTCAIYFSSNALYYPDNEESFCETIFGKNRYEWFGKRISKVYKHIFIRDVYKQWYIRGINKKLSNQQAVLDWLKKETQGMHVITVGSSAGGYAASLFGTLLKANQIFAFSPQFYLLDNKGKPIKDLELPEVLDGTILQELDIREVIRSNRSIFYFYPSEVNADKFQLHKLGQTDINVIKIKSRTHGIPFPNAALGTVLEMPKESLYLYGGG